MFEKSAVHHISDTSTLLLVLSAQLSHFVSQNSPLKLVYRSGQSLLMIPLAETAIIDAPNIHSRTILAMALIEHLTLTKNR